MESNIWHISKARASASSASAMALNQMAVAGGTAKAAINLIGRMGGEVVGASFVVELLFLSGRARLGGIPTFSLIQYA